MKQSRRTRIVEEALVPQMEWLGKAAYKLVSLTSEQRLEGSERVRM